MFSGLSPPGGGIVAMLVCMTATSERVARPRGRPDAGRWVMLIVLLCGQFMALLDVDHR